MTQLSAPLRAAIAFGVVAAITWFVVASLSVFFEVDVEFGSLVLLGAMAGVIVSVATELVGHEKRWVRALGGLLIAAVVIAVLFVALVIWYGSQICENGCS